MNNEILNSYPYKNESNPARVIDGEAVIVTPADSLLHSLNEQATFIWNHADGTRSVSDIAELMCAQYEVDAVQARQDLLDFVEACVNKDLLSLQAVPQKRAAEQNERQK